MNGLPDASPINLTAPSQVGALLARYGLRPDRRLGQHFLVDANILAKVVEAAEVRPGDAILEVGPGLGTLTRALAGRGARVVAVEIDRRLLPVLDETLAGYEGVQVVHGDALRVDLDALCPPPPAWKVVANIPYNITGPLVARLLLSGTADGRPPGRYPLIVLMVQEEVARRMTATPGGKEYGAFTLLVRYHAEVEPVARVSRSCFFPPPEVGSAVIRLRARARPPVEADPETLFTVVRAAFAQRRKSLRNALAAGLRGAEGRAGVEDEVEAALRQAGVDGGRRGEALSLEEFAALARAWAALSPETVRRQKRSNLLSDNG